MALSIATQFVLAVAVVTLWRHAATHVERSVVEDAPEFLETDPLPRDGRAKVE